MTQQPSFLLSQNKDLQSYYHGLTLCENNFEDGCKIKCLNVYMGEKKIGCKYHLYHSTLDTKY